MVLPRIALRRPARRERRRRFRGRLLAAMLLVAVAPLALLAAVVVADLGSVSRHTVEQADSTLLDAQAGAQERLVSDRARTLQVSVDAIVTQLAGLRQRVADAVRARSGAPPAVLPPLGAAASLLYLQETPPGGRTVTTVLAVPPVGRTAAPAATTALPGAAAATAASAGTPGGSDPLAEAYAVTLAAEPAMEAALSTAGVRDVWVADTAAGLVRTVPALDVIGAVATGALDPVSPLTPGDGAPFSALAAHAADAAAAAPPFEVEAVSPADLGTRPAFTAPYRTARAGGVGVTAFQALPTGHAVVGMDVDVRALVASVSDTAVSDRRGAGTLLVGAGGRVLGGTADSIASLRLGGEWVGTPLPRGPLRTVLDPVLGSGAAGPNRTSLAGTDEVLYTAPVTAAHWVLVSVVPVDALLPDQGALSRGIDSGIGHILVDLIPIVIGAVLLAVLLAGLAARRAVGPLRELTAAAERIGGGDVETPVGAEGRDEFGLLAESLERMRVEVNSSRDALLAAARELEGRVLERTTQLRERNEELVALNRLAGSLTQALEPDRVLAGGLESLAAFLPVRAARGYVLDDGRLRWLCSSGDPGPDADGLGGVATAALEIHDLCVRQGRGAVLAGLPLETRDGPLGAIALRLEEGFSPSGRVRGLLRAVADQVGLALRTAALGAEGRELAVLAERARLAREIHDTLAQELTGIVLQLESAEALIARDGRRGRALVVAARDQARAALQEARRSVWNLRPQPLEATGITGAVSAEAARFGRRTGIPVRVDAAAVPRDLAVSPQAEVALFRILQEALANAGRHSGAHAVEVVVSVQDGQIVLVVRDDGVGFDTETTPAPERFGLVGMEERARLVGASLQVTSRPGVGTEVTVALPVEPVAAGMPR